MFMSLRHGMTSLLLQCHPDSAILFANTDISLCPAVNLLQCFASSECVPCSCADGREEALWPRLAADYKLSASYDFPDPFVPFPRCRSFSLTTRSISFVGHIFFSRPSRPVSAKAWTFQLMKELRD